MNSKAIPSSDAAPQEPRSALSPAGQKMQDRFNFNNLCDHILNYSLTPSPKQLQILKDISKRQNVPIPQEVVDKLKTLGINLQRD
jgi:hypothetical protein